MPWLVKDASASRDTSTSSLSVAMPMMWTSSSPPTIPVARANTGLCIEAVTASIMSWAMLLDFLCLPKKLPGSQGYFVFELFNGVTAHDYFFCFLERDILFTSLAVDYSVT